MENRIEVWQTAKRFMVRSLFGVQLKKVGDLWLMLGLSEAMWPTVCIGIVMWSYVQRGVGG